ncbi:hypothetical protein ABR737_25270 [Streptomyces sp. Edi2]|uniref:hypothetical protein n=1 Tax=Streptomyces sp. Edi2 TaxID=3162528 RepID=UPI0033064CB3
MTRVPAAPRRPAGLDALLDRVAAQLPAEQAVADTRASLAFSADEQSPALAALRDALLDPAEYTPAAALTTAYVLLAAHTRELAHLAEQHTAETREQHGVTRSSRGLLTGMGSIRKVLDRHATSLDDRASK